MAQQQGGGVNITTLPLERLGPIKQQLEGELESLTGSLQQLQQALDRFATSKEALATVKPENKGTTSLSLVMMMVMVMGDGR
jgi:prefoldin subunit 5